MLLRVWLGDPGLGWAWHLRSLARHRAILHRLLDEARLSYSQADRNGRGLFGRDTLFGQGFQLTSPVTWAFLTCTWRFLWYHDVATAANPIPR